ncbi:hypothetical protein L7F22_061812 [Adiantum nelumboides]|nr:hypothetical protein [Adiantum nelumboides]
MDTLVSALPQPCSLHVSKCIFPYSPVQRRRAFHECYNCKHASRPVNIELGTSRRITAIISCQLHANGADRRLAAEVVNSWRSFELPPLYSRFPMRFPPHYDESLQEECDAWGLSFMSPSAPAAQAVRQAYLNGRYHLLGAVFYPSCCSRRRLILLTKLTLFTFIIDDIMELTCPTEAAALLRVTLAAWKSGSRSKISTSTAAAAFMTSPCNSTGWPARTEQIVALVERFLREVWEEMCHDMIPAFQALMEGLMLEWLLKEGSDQIHPTAATAYHSTASVDECMASRMSLVGAESFFRLVEYSMDIDIGDQLTSVPVMAELKKHLLRHYIWVNDLLSFRKEFLQDGGQYYSGRGVVGVLIAQAASSSEAVDLQAIINKVWGMIQAEEEIIEHLANEIRARFCPYSIGTL